MIHWKFHIGWLIKMSQQGYHKRTQFIRSLRVMQIALCNMTPYVSHLLWNFQLIIIMSYFVDFNEHFTKSCKWVINIGIRNSQIVIFTNILRQHTENSSSTYFFPPTYLTNITTAALTHETLMIWRKVFGVFCFKIILISEDTSKFYDRKTWSSSEIGLVRDPEKSLNRRYRE